MNVDVRSRNQNSDMCAEQINGNDDPKLTPESSITGVNKYSTMRVWRIFGILLTSLFVLEGLILRRSQVSAERIKGEKGFMVYNEGCRMADLDPLDDFSRSYMIFQKPIACKAGSQSPLIESNSTSVFVNEAALHQFYPESETPSCCWRSFDREKKHDDKVEFDEKCEAFTTSSRVTAEFVRVECYRKEKQIYRDYHFFVPRKEAVEKRCEKAVKSNNKQRKLSVLILGFNEVSRMNMHRMMPKTVNVLKNLGAVEMLGYTKIGENGYPNMIPLLTGLTAAELEKSECRNAKTKHFDDCPFLWKHFSKSGYRTILAEDACFMATFNYGRLPGFYNQPTDYYWRPYCVAAENDIDNTNRIKRCVGTRLTYQNLLNYTRKVASEFANEPYFGLFWQSSLTHGGWNSAKLGDDTYAEAFDSFSQKGWLENTALIVVGDHGIRHDDFHLSNPGKIETSLPSMFIVLPTWWKKTYPTAWANLQKNSASLTTHFDAHRTILDMLRTGSITERSISKRMNLVKGKIPRAISLFLPTPEYRSCDMAGIPPDFCKCHKKKEIPVGLLEVKIASNYLVNKLNEILENSPQCPKIELKSVLRAQKWNQGDTRYGVFPWSDFDVTIETVPGNGIFEASIRRTVHSDNNTLVGPIQRLDTFNGKYTVLNNSQKNSFCLGSLKTQRNEEYNIRGNFNMGIHRV